MSLTAEESEHILPRDQSLGDVTDQLARIPLDFPTRGRWLIALALSSLLSTTTSGGWASAMRER